MVTVTQVTLTCDVCGNEEGVQPRTFGLDGKTYEVDLCPKDSKDLSKAAARYVSKARTGPATRGPKYSEDKRHRRAGNPATAEGTRGSGKRDSGRGDVHDSPQKKARAGRAEQPRAGSTRKRATDATGPRQGKGVFVYGIFPADIEVAAGRPGVGENPGLMRAIRAGDLAALVSEVRLSGRLGSPDDLRIHRKTLDASAPVVPVLALPFGTVLDSDEAVVEELLAAHRDEFAEALRELEGRAQFVVRGRYLEEAVAASREQDTRAVEKTMEGQYVASVRKPAQELDAVHVAFLVDIDQHHEVERVIEDLAREWDGRIQLRLLGPMAAYDFVATMEVGC
jgi:Gas vesicle synthesis protein GvpL/GvpF/Lsr2